MPKRRRGSRACRGVSVIGAVVAALLSTALVQPSAAQAAASTADSEELSEGQKALAEAQESGSRVEVTGQRSERTTVFANPDGYTFTLQESSVPVRVSKPGGGWETPDATLEKRADGSISPKAAAPQIVFSSGGGEDPLARIASQGRSIELSWPGGLPEPELDGASAVYADVLPDVDLKVTATVESFQHVLVVKTPEAAADEKLKKITFGLKTTGLAVQEGASGSLAAVDPNGQTVFKAPPARMWNSAGKTLAQPSAPQVARAAAEETTLADSASSAPSDLAESALSGSGVEPGQGDEVATMDVEVGKESLSILPDPELLAERDASVFPLFIDPSVTWGESERTLLRSDGYESYGWGNGDDGWGKGAGKCGTWSGYYCGPGYVQKLYFEFSPASLKGKHVLDATFRVTEPWAFQCDPRWVDLVRTNNISSSTTWSSRPKELDWMGDRHVSAGRGDLCSPGLPDAAIEFNDNPEETNENLTPTVKDFAAGKFSRLTLEIRAHDESDTSAWKRFKNDAVLEVSFVGIPDKPSGIGLVTGSGTVCSTNESNPTIVSDPTPALTATTQTKAGGEEDAQLRIAFDVDRKNTDGTWADTNAGTDDSRPSTGYAGDGKKQTITWSTLTEGPVYRYRAWTQSFYNGYKSHLSSPSNGSTTGFCYFKVDPTAPKAPKITVGSPYKECLPNDCQALGGPGQKATFSFAPATGDTGVVSYQYTLSGMTTWPTANGSSASVSVAQAGTYTLWVRAKDNVGRYGAWNTVDFLVAAGAGPIARYHFNEADGVAVDAATDDGKDDATLSAGASRPNYGRRGLITHDAQGQLLATPVDDKGLKLDGTGGYAATSGPAVETRSSYTISAWARVTPGATGTKTVLSQDGGSGSPFYVSYGADGIKDWSLRVLTAKDGAYTWNKARAKQTSPTGVWTHLTASFDADNNKVRLYVNGVFQSEVDAGVPWSATGGLQIGRAKWSGNYVDYFDGVVDEVTVWQRTLTSEEIAKDAKLLVSEQFAGVELIADWNPTRGVDGTTIKDTVSSYGKSLTLAGGAAVIDEEIVLDGVDDAATAAGPVVDGSSSFTVTTGVTLDGAKLLTKDIGYIGQVAGQRTADGSAWGLWFELTGRKTVLDEETMEEITVPEGKWHFGRLESDGTFSSVTSEETASVDSGARLTGVHDSVDGTISLYIGYSQNGDAKAYTAQIGSGDFAVGKAYASGGWKHFLPARISDVRLWAGAMASAEQVEVTVGD
ncbi:LamG-like jellyroll fold domain-containing protein [Streptomyces sp. NPDC048584]|uniref:LamG-like jellyroll fold domain-containing protein n=1 Tax=Streptomyces sp. NPDC048584 TaxID=3365573 RepID=UPI00371CC621